MLCRHVNGCQKAKRLIVSLSAVISRCVFSCGTLVSVVASSSGSAGHADASGMSLFGKAGLTLEVSRLLEVL